MARVKYITQVMGYRLNKLVKNEVRCKIFTLSLEFLLYCSTFFCKNIKSLLKNI